MTTFHPELFRGLQSHRGQAHVAGGGPRGACCRECRSWDGDPKKPSPHGQCGKHLEFRGDDGLPVPGDALACKYFDGDIALPVPPSPGARFVAIAMQELPSGWIYSFRKSLSGRCFMRQGRIEAPKPVTRKALYVWLHECAHALKHYGNRKARHVEEYEAEHWAHARMRAHGVPVPRAMTQRAKHDVAGKIREAKLSGAKRIDPRALQFSKRFLSGPSRRVPGEKSGV
jgi:hypothetical protein